MHWKLLTNHNKVGQTGQSESRLGFIGRGRGGAKTKLKRSVSVRNWKEEQQECTKKRVIFDH